MLTEAPKEKTIPAAILPRTVITTGRGGGSAPAAELKVTAHDVAAVSKLKKDAPWYARRRLAALKTFAALPMPSLSDEAWRRTDIRAYHWGDVVLPGAAVKAKAAARIPPALLKPLVGKNQGGQLIQVPGEKIESDHAATLKKQKVVFTDVLTATKKYPDLVKKYLGKVVPTGEGKFSALAEAMADYGLFVYVPKNTAVELPLHSVAWLSGASHFGRILIVVDDGASATVVHETSSPNGKSGLHAATVEVKVGKKARL
ncbi:MAG: hypothetical protein JNL73_04240, partial [Anaerolineales bacterium]|nr:hypothetical protein [Anaerolineales bacterium]